ncbi:alginate lyase family protein [Caulobacter sp. DWP3-1-3b2]|uniref:heparinase II/III family protein n=1 Tax=Caulobacter sp. DWP3-1-3b2 TaxID=2804643 RepID=UPI003CEB117A
MSLTWYVRRLSSMSPAELSHRVLEQIKRRASRRRTYGWAAFADESRSVPRLSGLGEALREGASLDRRAEIEAAAKRVLAGDFFALGAYWPRRSPEALFPPDVWALDPITGLSWDNDQFCFDVPYRHERSLGDVKYVWEFNRLQFLQPLGAHVALTQDPNALRALEEAIGSWHRANPPFQGLGWNSGIEIGLRAVTLVIVSSLCGDQLSPDALRRVREILTASLYWLRRYPSRFSSANNHLIAESVGEYLICLSMPWIPDAARHGAHAARVLETESQKQILADGAPAEQSPTYGAFSVEMLLLAAWAGAAANAPLAASVEHQLRKFADFVLWMTNADGKTPAIGDDDEGRVITLCGHEDTYADSVAAAILGTFERSGVGGLVSRARVELRDTIFSSPAGDGEVEEGLRTFPDGGYTIVREKRAGRATRLAVDHGPLGYLSIAAHGHADANAIILTVDGIDVLVDPGTYLYHSGGAWRDWFRGTRSHNTMTIAGVDQSLISGPFNWSHKALGRLDSVERRDQGLDWRLRTSHDGYLSRFGVRHVRVLEPNDQGYIIHDRLERQGAHANPHVELVFQLAADLQITEVIGGYRVEKGGAPLIEILLDPSGQTSVASGGALGEGGWVSPSFGVKIPAPRISWRGLVPDDGVKTSFRMLGGYLAEMTSR